MISKEVKDIIVNAKIDGIDNKLVFAYKIPSKINIDVNKIVILITDISNDLDGYGSNDYFIKSQKAQVQLFFPAKYCEDTEIVEDNIVNYLRKNGWFKELGSGLYALPDSDRTCSTIQIYREKRL